MQYLPQYGELSTPRTCNASLQEIDLLGEVYSFSMGNLRYFGCLRTIHTKTPSTPKHIKRFVEQLAAATHLTTLHLYGIVSPIILTELAKLTHLSRVSIRPVDTAHRRGCSADCSPLSALNVLPYYVCIDKFFGNDADSVFYR